MSLAVPQIFDERRGLTNVNESNLSIHGVAAALNSNCLVVNNNHEERRFNMDEACTNEGNIETGLSAEDSLALAPQHQTIHITHVLPSQEREKIAETPRISKLMWIIGTTLVIVAIVLLSVLLPSDRKEDIPRESPQENIFDATNTTSSSRLEILREMLSPISGIESLSDESSSQYSALVWLADEDPAQLDLNESDFDEISDRYIVALLYFVTSGFDWRVQRDFLSEKSICEWNDGGEGGAFEGIRCKKDDVVEIILGRAHEILIGSALTQYLTYAHN